MGSIHGYLGLMRLERAISAMVGVVITGVIVGDLVGFDWGYVVACLVVFFSALANFALNDIHDIEIDRVNQRADRPLAAGVISRESAETLAAFSAVLAVGLSMFLSPFPRFMVLAGLPLSLLYNVYLKRYLIFKNLFTGLANVGVILMGALIVDSVIEPLAYYIALVGFFFSISYEVMLDIGDIEGDRAMGVETIPVRFGRRNAALLSIVIGLGAVFADPLPFFVHVDSRLFGDYVFLVLILVPVVNRMLISRALLLDHSPENIRGLRKRLFRNLQLGGVCYLIGFLL